MSIKVKKVVIFTDGACSGNPGPGGWGAVIYKDETKYELSGYSSETTNNRMEIVAAIKALESLKEKCSVSLNTDSNYLKLGITTWILNWKRNYTYKKLIAEMKEKLNESKNKKGTS